MNQENKINRLFQLISILSNQLGSSDSEDNKDNKDNENYNYFLQYYSIFRLQRITHIPINILREDLYQLSLHPCGLLPLDTDDIKINDSYRDFLASDLFLQNFLDRNDYPDIDTLNDLYNLYDTINETPNGSTAERRKLFHSGKIDALPFCLSNLTVFSPKYVHIALSRKEYDILDDFLIIHRISSVQESDSFTYDEKLMEGYISDEEREAVSTKLSKLYGNIIMGYDIKFHYKSYKRSNCPDTERQQDIETHYICLIFFPHTGKYYMAGIADEKISLYDLQKMENIDTGYLSPISTEEEQIKNDFMNHVLPHLFGPSYEDKPTTVEIDFYDDHDGRLFQKVNRVLNQYPLLKDETSEVDDLVYHKGIIKKRHVEMLVYDRESFFDWIVMLGQSAVLLQPQDLRDRIISYYTQILDSDS